MSESITSNKPLHYQHPFPFKRDDVEYYLLTSDYVFAAEFGGQEIARVAPQTLALLTRQAFHDVSFMLRPAHQQQIADILYGPEASENDKYVTLQFLRNSDITAKDILPTCQGAGTAIIVGKKGQHVWTGGGDEEALVRGVYNTYTKDNLRYLQSTALDIYREVNTGTDLPVQIDLYAVDGDEYKFLYIAKGGGSANKTYLYQEIKALPTPGKLKNYLVEKMRTLGTAACPSYHIAFVIGGTLAEATLETAKLASIRCYDGLPTEDNEHDQAFRDVEPEKGLLIETQNLGLGAQFGRKYFVCDVRVIHLPCYGASYLAGMGVSCSVDRNIKVEINREGIWTERLEHNLGEFISEELHQAGEGKVVCVDLNRPVKEILTQPSQYLVSTRLLLSDTIIAGRDITYARPKERLDNGENLPQYVKDHLTYYAGLAKTPEGYALDSLRPTMVGHMDLCVSQLQAVGGSAIMLVKGNRDQQVTGACHRHGDFYLDSVGGPAMVLTQGSIKNSECMEHPEFGMEAIWKIGVEDFPAFILVDDKGNDFLKQVQTSQCARCAK